MPSGWRMVSLIAPQVMQVRKWCSQPSLESCMVIVFALARSHLCRVVWWFGISVFLLDWLPWLSTRMVRFLRP